MDLEFYDPYGELCVEAGGDPVRLRAIMRSIYEPRRGDVEEQAALQSALEASQPACAGHARVGRTGRPHSTAHGGQAQGRGRQPARGRGQRRWQWR